MACSFQGGHGVTNLLSSQMSLERATIDGDSPVGERDEGSGHDLEYHGTRVILWESGGPTLQG